jgi:hypothetical protein
VCLLSEWADKCESVLTAFQAADSIPYDFERYTPDTGTNQLPDQYIVYFLVDDEGKGYADGKETSHEPRIQISYYTRDKSDFLAIPGAIDAAFVNAGFTRGPTGHIPYQPDTRHYGWQRNFYFYERR